MDLECVRTISLAGLLNIELIHVRYLLNYNGVIIILKTRPNLIFYILSLLT